MDKKKTASLVCIVDDDESVRKALKRLIVSTGGNVEVFSSIEEFIHSGFIERSECLIVDVHMLGGSGFDLKEYLSISGHDIPVIFITAHDSEETRKRAEQVGCKGYLKKPFDDQLLLDAIDRACREEFPDT